jgi:membrane-bound lytic murein transglycosylase
MSQRNYRKLCLDLDPGCTIKGPIRMGHYLNYSVYDSAGKEIGWSEGNERGEGWAWLRAYGALKRRVAA